MGLPLPEAGMTQTVVPSIFLRCVMQPLSSSTICESFDWARPAQLADPLVLTDQVAFARCVSQCLEVPPPIVFSVVF